MKKIIVAVFVGGIAGGAGAVVETRQAEAWERIELQGGAAEFRLRNDDGASVILGCQLNGVGSPGSWTNAERGGGLAISHRFFGCPQTSIALHGLLRGEAVEQAVATRRPQQFLAARTAIVS